LKVKAVFGLRSVPTTRPIGLSFAGVAIGTPRYTIGSVLW
jgi:hypothetical protein